jgi:hypothetical protein
VTDENAAACAGKWWLFDSTDLADHIEAASICADCPIRLQCHDAMPARLRTEHWRGVNGTWAGALYLHGRKAEGRWENACRKCGAKPGKPCRGPSGKHVKQPHQGRLEPEKTACPGPDCGRVFKPTRQHYKYCSDECSEEARRRAQIAYGARRPSRAGERKAAS